MTIDDEGYLWVALFNGGSVHRYSTKGDLDTVIEVPAAKVTCCTFAGPDLADLYITTASIDLSDEERKDQPSAGGLFRCQPGVTGHAPFAFGG